MKIISRFRDYYDVVSKYGNDESILYIREQKEILLKKNEAEKYPKTKNETRSSLYSMRNFDKYTRIEMLYLGYCGKIYPYVKVTEVDGPKHKTDIFWDLNIFKEYSQQKLTWIKWKEKSYWGLDYFSTDRGRDYERFFNGDTSKLLEIFQKYNSPLFIYEEIKDKEYKSRLLINPELNTILFFQKKDPYTAFQDISQYVSGVLNQPENKMIELSNDEKRDKHGFDKWSFKKMPKNKK